MFDGEIMALGASGKPSFQALQHAGRPRWREPRPIFNFAFELLNFEERVLLSLALLERKRLLAELLNSAPPHLRSAEFLNGDPKAIAAEICRHNLEGIVAKLAQSRHEPDKRSRALAKWKCGYEQEFVFVGYTRRQSRRAMFGALLSRLL